MNYDVPRPAGFYWVILDEINHPEPIVAENRVELCGQMSREPYLDQDWFICGDECGGAKPDHVFCRCERIDPDNILGVYKLAALFAKGMEPGSRFDMEGQYCVMKLRNPKPRKDKPGYVHLGTDEAVMPPGAKAAPKKAGSRTRRPPR